MKNLFSLFALFFLLSPLVWSTVPIRRLPVVDEKGRLRSISIDSLQDLRLQPATDRCPSELGIRSTRSFITTGADGLGKFGQRSRGILNSIGESRIPVIMVEFSDVKFRSTTTPSLLNRIFNESGYKQNARSKGSVRDYFLAQSYSKFSPRFDVLGKVSLSNPVAYYGHNDGNSVNSNIYLFYKEALQQATAAGLDFHPYIENGKVPLVILFFAGLGEHDCKSKGAEDYIWPHFKPEDITVGGVRFASYFVGNELMETYKYNGGTIVKDSEGYPVVAYTETEGIGVLCHELSHALGLPDLYSTDNVERQTPDVFDLMDYGQYWNDGYRPMGYSAYERNCMGWLQLVELTETAQSVTLAPLHQTAATSPQGLILRSAPGSSEYYTFENRQESDWFPSKLGTGMLVYHIDYDLIDWENNQLNRQPSHLRCTIFPADNAWQGNSTDDINNFRGDFFPGIQNIRQLGTQTTPTISWFGTGVERNLYNISINGDRFISFAYQDKDITGIHSPCTLSSMKKEPYYSMDGRRVKNKIFPGLYISGKRKIIFEPSVTTP